MTLAVHMCLGAQFVRDKFSKHTEEWFYKNTNLSISSELLFFDKNLTIYVKM